MWRLTSTTINPEYVVPLEKRKLLLLAFFDAIRIITTSVPPQVTEDIRKARPLNIEYYALPCRYQPQSLL